MAACTPQSPPRASKLAERLTTDARESFLGFQNNTSTFVTCAGTTLEIGHGTVEPTTEPCPSTQPYTPIALSGTIKAVDPEQHTLTLETEQGKQVDLFVPATAAHNAVNLREFKQNDYVAIGAALKTGDAHCARTAGLLARAESIEHKARN
jgi:hypothetical protein